ncbi:hypothetical protein C1646_749484 [Rhizophagus diaphanus]|nr:hypothetical protein C1646_749484 [Rhizophagus diaphanus] [Rhizophagus sp. MUCL 43196]
MPQEFSEDLCWCIIYLHIDRFSIADIANTLYMSKGFVNKIIRRYNHWHYKILPKKSPLIVKNPFKGISGHKKLFSRADMAVLRNFVAEKADWYLDKLVYEMKCLTGKRLHKVTLERNDIIREHYLGIIEGFVAVDIFEGACDRKRFVDLFLIKWRNYDFMKTYNNLIHALLVVCNQITSQMVQAI